MRIEVFCGWGDGPDVGINLERTEEEARGWRDPHLHFFYDMTADQADALADRLRECAAQARFHERSAQGYFARERSHGDDDDGCP